MQTIGTSCCSGARFWRVLVTHVLAIALIVSSFGVHVHAADLGVSTSSLSLTSDTDNPADGTSSFLGHGLVVHATCGCHVAAPAAAVTGVRLPISTAAPLPVPSEMGARPGPASLPFEPPRV